MSLNLIDINDLTETQVQLITIFVLNSVKLKAQLIWIKKLKKDHMEIHSSVSIFLQWIQSYERKVSKIYHKLEEKRVLFKSSNQKMLFDEKILFLSADVKMNNFTSAETEIERYVRRQFYLKSYGIKSYCISFNNLNRFATAKTLEFKKKNIFSVQI